MGRFYVFVAGLFLSLSSLPALAADFSAEAFLKDILSREFDGDHMARRSQVYYTDGKPAFVGRGDGVKPRESWDLDDDLNLVTSWAVVGVHSISAEKRAFDVRFHVAGGSRAQNFGSERIPYRQHLSSLPEQQIVLPADPFDEIVTYKVWLRKGRWRLVDSPLPRV